MPIRTLRMINGTPAKPLPLYDVTAPFTGQFDLSDERIWPDLVQTGVLTFSEPSDAQIGGCDSVKITANGSAITIPGSWKNIGSDSVSTTNGDVNRIYVCKQPEGIQYTVKVN